MIEQIVDIAIACLVSAGGIGGIIIAVVKFTSDTIASRLSAKYEVKLQEELEKQKTLNERKNYISQARFDKEFELYQDLSEKQITLVYDVGESVMFIRGMYADETNDAQNFMKRFTKDINEAQQSLKKYGAFISKEIFEQYGKLDEMCSDVYKLSLYIYKAEFEWKIPMGFNHKGTSYNTDLAKQEIENLQKKVSDLSNQIIDQIREYLHSLDVI